MKHRSGAGVLFTSGYSGAAVADRGALKADLLEKPFTIEQLAGKVRQALDARLSR
jgi:FixJ family two-component response regulator